MIRILLLAALAAAGVAAAPLSLRASEAEIVDAAASRAADGWRFDVTVRHDDSGWDHYADAWRIVGPDGAVYATRTLLHPHQDEQPFTRSISGVSIPAGVRAVMIEARDNVTGWSGAVLELILPD